MVHLLHQMSSGLWAEWKDMRFSSSLSTLYNHILILHMTGSRMQGGPLKTSICHQAGFVGYVSSLGARELDFDKSNLELSSLGVCELNRTDALVCLPSSLETKILPSWFWQLNGINNVSPCAGRQVCGAPAEQELGSNFKRMGRDVYVPDLIAASDCMLGRFFFWYKIVDNELLGLLLWVLVHLSVLSVTNWVLRLLQGKLVTELSVRRWLVKHLLCLCDVTISMKSHS